MSTPPFFGTDGIRGNAATSPFLQNDFLMRLGATIATWASRTTNTTPTILIARDTRASGVRIEQALRRGIASAGGTSITAGVLPTPALVSIVRASGSYALGVMITASHNGPADNGIKLCTARGKLTSEEEAALESILYKTTVPKEVKMPTTPHLPAHHALLYRSRISSFFHPNPLVGMTIALDCAHGATYQIAPQLFTSLGARVITLGTAPNGNNSNQECGSTNPSALRALMKRHRADVGFAFDGDGDRVIAVTATGEIKAGDDLLALLATHPRFTNAPAIVGTIMSNQGLADHLKHHEQKLIRTPVGDKHVLAKLEEYNLSLGGEPSGHIIVRDYLPTADGIFTAVLAAHTLQVTRNITFETFFAMAQTNLRVPVQTKHDLTQEPYASIIDAFQKTLGAGRSVVRYSGTEPVLRIMVEHPQATIAAARATTLRQQLEALFTPSPHATEKTHASPAL
ncbi:MAG: phosphoglucosamine mutase [Candidatus Dependentiae bacterium]|jgi:phosphoglucosamine mutase